MGKRPAGVELFEGNMASMQWEIRPSIQRDGTPTMETGLERIAERARCEPKLQFTSLAHHITEGPCVEESVSDSQSLGPRGGCSAGNGGEGKLRGMGWRDVAIHPPQGI